MAKRRAKKKAEDKAPLWAVMGVIVGAIIVYLAMEDGRQIRTASTASESESLIQASKSRGAEIRQEVPEGTIEIKAEARSFSPSSFRVEPGELVTLALTSVDEKTHILSFTNSKLEGIAVGAGPEETRIIRFRAPEEEGEYVFYKNMPGFQNVTGRMIVASK